MAKFISQAGSNVSEWGTYSGGFIPQIFSRKVNVKFYANTILTDISNTDWEGEIKQSGDAVTINNIPTITVRDYNVNTDMVSEVPKAETIQLLIDSGKYTFVEVSKLMNQQSNIDLINKFTDDATKQIKIKIEEDCFYKWFVTEGADAANKGANAGLRTGSYNMGTDTTPVASNNVYDTILAMAACLDEQDVPQDNRFVVLSPSDVNKLMASPLAQAQFTGDTKNIVRTGQIGRLVHFNVYVSNLLPMGAAGQVFTSAHLSSGGTPATLAGAKKRRMIISGHKSALTYAGQMIESKMVDIEKRVGDYLRNTYVYGKMVVKPTALCTGIIAS